jgi:RNA polymerase subunit RPABC4/transcription elongation factor Spt4
MPLSKEALLALENPYKTLNDGDALAEHQGILDLLSKEEMLAFASTLIFNCPQKELSQFGHAINALRSLPGNTDSFHGALSKALELRKRLSLMLDSGNSRPYQMMLDEESYPALFQEYKELTMKLLNGKEHAIAERLALTTPKAQRSEVAHNIQITFAKGVLASEVNKAYTLVRHIELLVGEQPEQFFTTADYNKELCHEFPGLFVVLDDHEDEIAKKLAETAAITNRYSIIAKITEVFGAHSRLLSLVQDAFKAIKPAHAANPNLLFAGAPAAEKQEKPAASVEQQTTVQAP